MIKTKDYGTRADGVKLKLTYSTKNLVIRKVGTNELYNEAVDVENAGFEYEETETPIEQDGGDEE